MLTHTHTHIHTRTHTHRGSYPTDTHTHTHESRVEWSISENSASGAARVRRCPCSFRRRFSGAHIKGHPCRFGNTDTYTHTHTRTHTCTRTHTHTHTHTHTYPYESSRVGQFSHLARIRAAELHRQGGFARRRLSGKRAYIYAGLVK